MKNTNTESGYVSAETITETKELRPYQKAFDEALDNKWTYHSALNNKPYNYDITVLDKGGWEPIIFHGETEEKLVDHICKTHNDWLKFKQKKRSKKESKKNAEKKTPLEQRVDDLEKMVKDIWKNICAGKSSAETEDNLPTEIINKKPIIEGRRCPHCKNSKNGCEFYDKGTCRGICYPTYPPQYDPCVFEK